MAQKQINPNIEGHAVQWKDLSPRGRQITSEAVAETGDAPGRAAARLERGGPKNVRSEEHAQKTAVKLESLKLVTPLLRRAKVTLQTAATRRMGHYSNAVVNEHGDPEGSGWYFQHHGEIAGMAAQHGYDKHTAITASAVMSPNNDPENEKAAVGSLMDAHTNHTVRITPRLATAINARTGRSTPKLGRAHYGKDIAFSDLHPEHIAALSSGDFRDKKKAESKIPIQTSAGEGTTRLLTNISRGGTKTNIVKAIGVLRGDTPRETAIDPHSSPKVWSYHNAIQSAVPNSAEHIEYMSRVGMAHGHGQGALDFGLRHSTEGILNPQGHTAEDTWMNAISSGQRMRGMWSGRAGRSSLISAAKTYGSESRLGFIGAKTHPTTGESAEPDARVGAPALHHAFNNRATQMAASTITKKSGMEGAGLPSVAVQEVSWTQARREAGADAEFNQREREAPTSVMGGTQFRRTEQTAAEKKSERDRQVKGQQGFRL